MNPLKTLLAVALALALVASACGDDGDDAVATGAPAEPAAEPADEPMEHPAEEPMEDEAAEPAEEPMEDAGEGFPVSIAAGNGEVTIEGRPERIVSISTVATETLFAIGAGDQVIAVDDQSNFPTDAPVTDLSGFTPSVEAIAEFEPDLVILSFDPGDIVAGLDALGITTILHGTAFSLDEAYAQIEQTGAATGHLAEAAALVADMQARIDAAVASVEPLDPPPSIFHEVSFDLFSSTSATFIGQLYALFGVENIADPADEEGFGFPQLSAEYILEADPDMIFLGDLLYGENAGTVSVRPGWDALTAVTTGQIIELDTDVASRWGPRIPELVEAMAAALNAYTGVAA